MCLGDIILLCNGLNWERLFLLNFKEFGENIVNYLHQSPFWEANVSSSQEISRILWNPEFPWACSKESVAFPSSQFHPIDIFQSCFMKNCFNIIFSFASMSFKCSLSCRFPHQNNICISFSPHIYHVIRPAYSPGLVKRKLFDEKC